MNKDQNGFSVVEAVIIIVIVGLIGGVGWYVWTVKQNADKNLKAAGSSTVIANTKKTKATQVPDEQPKIPEGWKLYTDKETGIKFTYPQTWETSSTFTSSLAVSDPDKAIIYEGCVDAVCQVKYSQATKTVTGRNGAETKKPVASSGAYSAYLIPEKGSLNCGSYGLLIPVGDKVIQSQLSLCTKPSGPDDHELAKGILSYEQTVSDLSTVLKSLSVN